MNSVHHSEQPICLVVLGMAASGKTTFIKNIQKHCCELNVPSYTINLDPAVYYLPYTPNIDIRTSINYKEIMHKFNLGPNGAIMTCLNLFSTKFDQVLKIMENRKEDFKYFIFDTPGQIEVFTWSASGSIICETLASIFPTIIIYIMDTSSIQNPVTFMSNMIYACSILYKMKLPFIIALNKCDIANPQKPIEWMQDFESFQKSIENDESYSANLMRSLSLVLDEFYSIIKTVEISSITGLGNEILFNQIQQSTKEYHENKKNRKSLNQSHMTNNDIIIKDIAEA